MNKEYTEGKSPIIEERIDIIALTKTIWDGRKTIIKSVLICFTFGLIVALFSTKEYTASTTMIPESSRENSKLGGLSSIAAMAGVNVGMSGGNTVLSPSTYPQIINSVPFQLELMNYPFSFPGIEQPVSILEYYTTIKKPELFEFIKKYTIGLPRIITNINKESKQIPKNNSSNNIISLNRNQENVRLLLEKAITIDINDKDGFLTLSARALDADLAAQVAHKSLQLLQQYITTFKIEKAKSHLKFIEERYRENKEEFEIAQAALADFRDKNKNVRSARAKTQEERLQSDYQLAFEVYSGLAQQLEQARIKVKEDTPVFSVIKPATVPLVKTKPKSKMILLIWTFMGGIIGVLWILGKQFLIKVQKQWNKGQQIIHN